MDTSDSDGISVQQRFSIYWYGVRFSSAFTEIVIQKGKYGFRDCIPDGAIEIS